ncbi:MAG TPA: NAD-binding protein [Chloroflexota bacterium]|nr:NAD-binding protein [Chloroflexota bacterium]
MAEAPPEDVKDFKDHVLICGWSPNVPRIIEGLLAAGALVDHPVVLVNQADDATTAEVRERFPAVDIHHVYGPYQIEATLKRAGAASAGAAIVVADTTLGPDADNRTIICTLALENLSGDVKTCAELLDAENEPNLKRTGVDEVVITGAHTGFFLSSGALAPGLSKAAHKLVTPGSGSELRRAAIPETLLNQPFVTLQEHVRAQGGMVLGIIRESAVVTTADLFGSGQDWIDVFIRSAFEASGEDVLHRDAEPVKVIINPQDDFLVEFKDSAILIGAAAIQS